LPDRRQALSEDTNEEKVIAPVKNNFIRGSRILQNSTREPKILGARRVTITKLKAKEPNYYAPPYKI
jgi:hypothetical protein